MHAKYSKRNFSGKRMVQGHGPGVPQGDESHLLMIEWFRRQSIT